MRSRNDNPFADPPVLNRMDAGIPEAATTAIGPTSKNGDSGGAAQGSTAVSVSNPQFSIPKAAYEALSRTGSNATDTLGRAKRRAGRTKPVGPFATSGCRDAS